MGEPTSAQDAEEKYAGVEGIYVDDEGDPRPKLAELSKSGGSGEDE